MTASVTSLLSTSVFGNAVSAYIITLGLFAVIFLGLHLLLVILKNRLDAFSKKTKTQVDDTLSVLLRAIHPFEYLCIALFLALQTLTLHPLLSKIISIAFITLFTYMVIHAASTLLSMFLQRTVQSDNL